MASSDEDEENLKLALALSMQQSPSDRSPHVNGDDGVIDFTADTDEDDDMRRAIALSLREMKRPSSREHHAIEGSMPATSSAIRKSGSSTAFIPTATSSTERKTSFISTIDRATMEQERLARLSKRKRNSSIDQPSKRTTGGSGTRESSQYTTLQYPKGAIKRTFASKYPRTDDISIDEVLQADTINIAVVGSFMWDAEWLHRKLNPLAVKQIWVMNAKGQDIQQRWREEMKESGVPNLRLHFPPMDGIIQSNHSKFMLLFGKEKLRVVIPTANMTCIDWGEAKYEHELGLMENSVFLVDLPRMHDGVVGDKDSLTTFGKELIYFLEKLEMETMVIDGVLKFDFSQTSHLGFVHAM
jgi:hypothetical protein